MLPDLLANASPDTQISGTWVLELVGKIFVGLGALFTAIWIAYRKGQSATTVEATLKSPVPSIHVKAETKEDVELVTKEDLNEHLQRIDKAFDEIKEALDGERSIARTANGNLHKRIDAMSERLGDRLSNLEGTAKSTAETVGKLLDIALGKKPTGR